MTVLELIEQLQQIRIENGDDTEVKFCYDSRDHWHTQVCDGIDSVQMLAVTHSDYHSKDRLASEEELERLEDEGEEPQEICIIR